MSVAARLVKPWIVMPLVALLAFGGWIVFRPASKGSPPAAAFATEQTVEATSGPMARTVSASGTVAAEQTEDLNFAAAGAVTAVDVKAGDKVKTGQVLAEMDSADLAAAVAAAQATVAEAEASLTDSTDSGASDAKIAADTSALKSAQDKLERAGAALSGATLKAGFDGTVAVVDLTVGEQLTAGGTGAVSPSGSGSGSGISANTLGSASSAGSSRQPAAGSSATTTGSSSAQIQIVSSGMYTVDLGFDSTDVADLAVGQPATVTLSTATSNSTRRFPGAFAGGNFPAGAFPGLAQQTQQGAATAGGQATSAQASGAQTGAQSRAAATGKGVKGFVTSVGAVANASSGVATFPVTVLFTDDSGEYNVGANVDVAITYAQLKDAVQVPLLAVTTTDGAATVTVDNAGKHETRTVTTGLTAGAMVQITDGLKAGEQVVLALPGRNRFGNGAGGQGSARTATANGRPGG